MKKFEERLLEEWKQHGKIIVAVDYDDTISPWRYTDEDAVEQCEKIIKLLIDCKSTGAYIVVFTACNENRYADIQVYCESKGLNISCINHNPIDLPYGKNGKIYANIFLDDRGGLYEAIEILTNALYSYRGYLESNKNLSDCA